jgi:hypothetical protein
VVSLGAENMLHVVGTAVPDLWDKRGNEKGNEKGQIELYYIYDVLEVTPWLGGPLSPCMGVHLKISNGKLTPDKEKCVAEWKKTLLQDEARLKKELKIEPESYKAPARLSFILKKLLFDYVSGKGEEAWLNFRTNLKPLLNEKGEYVTFEKTHYTSTEIEDYLRKAMSRQCNYD